MHTDRRALRRTLLIFGVTAALGVGAVAGAAALTHDDASGTPEHTVRDFLGTALAGHNGFQACRYMTRRALLEVHAVGPRDTSCETAMARARLTLGGEPVDSEAAVKGLTYRVERERGGRIRVTVSARGESRSFRLRRGTRVELAEFQAPSTPWRIDSGVTGLLAP